jgi:amino acid transporter
MEEEKGVYVRKATGIVRGFTALDAFAICIGVVALGAFGTYMHPVLVDITFPGGGHTPVLTIALIPALLMGMAYVYFSTAMPRSGGDYVYISRVISPALGFAVSWAIVILGTFTIGPDLVYQVSTSYSVGLTTLATVYNAPGFLELASLLQNVNVVFVIGTILVVIMLIIMLLPIKFIAWVLRTLMIIQIIPCFISAFLFLATPKEQFISIFNAKLGTFATYQGIINTAQSIGWTMPQSSLLVAFTAMGFGIYSYWGWTFPVYTAGETKKVTKSMPIGIIGGLLFCWFLMVLVGEAAYYSAGKDFLLAAAYLATYSPEKYPLPVFPWVNFFATMLTDNPILIGLILIGTPASWLMCDLCKFLMASRCIFAWSFDRVFPASAAKVSKKFHSPTVAAILTAIIIEIALVLMLFTPIFSYYMNIAGGLYICLSFVGLAAVLFPYKRPDIFEKAPGFVRTKIAGVPLMSIIGVLCVAFYVPIAIWSLTVPILGPVSVYAYAIIAIVYITGFIIYYVARYYRLKKEGIDIAWAFKELAPE